jgi:hypothetical protein
MADDNDLLTDDTSKDAEKFDARDARGATGGPSAGGGNQFPPPLNPYQSPSRSNGFGKGAFSRIPKQEYSLTTGERDTFTNVLSMVEENLAKQKEAKLLGNESQTGIERNVEKLINDFDRVNLDDEGRTLLNRLVGALAAQGSLPHSSPDFITQVRAPAIQAHADDKGIISKLITKIKRFTGTDDNYRWQHFWTQYSIAVQNAAYNRHELRVIFLSCLEGAALAHYQAFLHVYADYSYEQLVVAYKKRYDDTKEQSLASVMGKNQAANEDVLTFRDRLLISAAAFRPTPPNKQTIVRTAEGRDMLVDNFEYEQDKLKYEAKKQESELYLARFYVMGLRQEIIAKMDTLDFDSIDEAAEAAKKVEDTLKSMALMRNNHIRIGSVNATYEKQYKGTSPSGKKSDGNDKNDCFSCGGTGHWIRECPYRDRRRSLSRDRSRSRGRSHSRDRNSRQSTGEKFQASQIASLIKEEVQKACAVHFAPGKGGRGRKKRGQPNQNKKRQPSRSPARSAHGRSRSRSRSRSKSPGHGGRSNSRYTSSKN